ncbi:MAG: hypothetical protein D6780_05605 [Candidatus Dadabacteria bacterium]|nr:MAG: hypothetical protein D6780_05605 [Candidatus Dadabacteria bacterium]
MPAYSIFSAVSELVVTVIVYHLVWKNYKEGTLNKGLAIGVFAFELFVNMMYMIHRLQQGAVEKEVSSGLLIFFILHGSLSLVIFVLLGLYLWLAFLLSKKGRSFFKEHPIQMWIFICLWAISVLSGEAIFITRYILSH